MLEVKRQGIDLLIIPRNPPKEVFHKEANELLKNAVWFPLINFKMAINFLRVSLTKLSFLKILGIILAHSRDFRIFIKNLVVFPKAVFIAETIKRRNIKHIHAHWGSTTATMAYIISRLTGIPWSFTLHRWDIAENNLLKEKVGSAKFTRIISEHGKNELLEIIGKDYEEKIKVLHMGVEIPGNIQIMEEKKNNLSEFKMAVPANLVEKKGHKYLIEACSILAKQGIKNFQCIFYGEGPLRAKLENLIKESKLTNYIKMQEAIPNQKLLKMYENKEINLVVLPSIITKDDELEGIPVALMEAMAYKIPVISTNTGGIPELLSNGAGIIVEEKSPEQLAKAILKIIEEDDFREELSENGFQKIQRGFDIKENIKTLLELIQK